MLKRNPADVVVVKRPFYKLVMINKNNFRNILPYGVSIKDGMKIRHYLKLNPYILYLAFLLEIKSGQIENSKNINFHR